MKFFRDDYKKDPMEEHEGIIKHFKDYEPPEYVEVSEKAQSMADMEVPKEKVRLQQAVTALDKEIKDHTFAIHRLQHKRQECYNMLRDLTQAKKKELKDESKNR
jgi:hypothetical protein